jgi:hypothetical protein
MSSHRKKDAVIDIECIGRGEPMRFNVIVRDDGGMSQHQVTLSQQMSERLSSGGAHRADRIVEAAFRFLLAREPKESILESFDVSVISRYFPEFERELSTYFEQPR